MKLLSGELRGIRAPANIHTFTSGENPVRAWRVRPKNDPDVSYWVTSQYLEAEFLKCPLIGDAYDRWYLFEPGQPPQVTTVDDIIAGTGPWRLAFTYPTTAPTCVPDNTDPDNVRDVVYIYTYVTEWGEESAPSEPTTVSVDDAGTVTVSGFYSPTPVIEGRAYEYVRIYRSVTTEGTGGLFYVDQVDWGTDTYLDSKPDVEVSLNELIASQSFSAPPSGLYGARVHPSGSFVAFKDETIYFSEPYRPHAWPDTYKVAVAETIVGIEVFAQNVGVFTKGAPSMLYGSNPNQIGMLTFPFPEPCVSYGSILAAPEGAYYASHQGLVLFTAVGPRNITKDVISKEEWQTQYLSSDMSAARYGTQYVAIEYPGTGFVIDNLEPRVAITDFVFSTTLEPRSLSEDYYTGDVYMVSGDAVYEWDRSTSPEVDYLWKSKQEILPRPLNYGAIMVHLEPRDSEFIPLGPPPVEYPAEYFGTLPADVSKTTHVMLEVFANNIRVFVGWAGDREQVRLPSGVKADAWEIRITGQCRVFSVALTETGRGQSRVG